MSRVKVATTRPTPPQTMAATPAPNYWKVTYAMHDLQELEESLLNGSNVYQHVPIESRIFREVPIKAPPEEQADNIMTDGDLGFKTGRIFVYRNPSTGYIHLNGVPSLCPGDCIRDKFDHRPGHPKRRAWMTVLSVEQD